MEASLKSQRVIQPHHQTVVGYLNSKQAALFKRMIWEAMNKDYDKGKSRKRARMAKKAAPAKKPEKAVKVSTVMDTKNILM
ncbi:unnamed protein product [Prunus armeniaca]